MLATANHCVIKLFVSLKMTLNYESMSPYNINKLGKNKVLYHKSHCVSKGRFEVNVGVFKSIIEENGWTLEDGELLLKSDDEFWRKYIQTSWIHRKVWINFKYHIAMPCIT